MFKNVKAENARIFGSDDDSVAIGDSLEALLPEGLEPLGEDFTEVGWLSDDGIGFAPEDSVDKHHGHQGGRVVRTKMTTSETSFTFQALESKLSHVGLAMSIKKSETTVEGDATKHTMGGRKVERRPFVVDTYDEDKHYRWIIPIGEIGERNEFALSSAEITGWEFTVEIIGDFYLVTNDPAMAGAGSLGEDDSGSEGEDDSGSEPGV